MMPVMQYDRLVVVILSTGRSIALLEGGGQPHVSGIRGIRNSRM